MYALNLSEEKRILSVCIVLPGGNYNNMPIVDNFPHNNINDYLYVNGEFIHSPLLTEKVKEDPTQLDKIEAQIAYTALMTDTLITKEW